MGVQATKLNYVFFRSRSPETKPYRTLCLLSMSIEFPPETTTPLGRVDLDDWSGFVTPGPSGILFTTDFSDPLRISTTSTSTKGYRREGVSVSCSLLGEVW